MTIDLPKFNLILGHFSSMSPNILTTKFSGYTVYMMYMYTIAIIFSQQEWKDIARKQWPENKIAVDSELYVITVVASAACAQEVLGY